MSDNKPQTYTVELLNTLITYIEVEANSQNQAEEIAKAQYDKGEITFNSDDSIGVEFYAVEEF